MTTQTVTTYRNVQRKPLSGTKFRYTCDADGNEIAKYLNFNSPIEFENARVATLVLDSSVQRVLIVPTRESRKYARLGDWIVCIEGYDNEVFIDDEAIDTEYEETQ